MSATPNPLGRLHGPARQSPLSLAPGCLAVVGVCVAIGVAAARYLPASPSGDPTVPRIFAALIGAIGGLGLSTAWSVVTGRTGGSRKALHARARSDGPTEDGAPIVATGVIRADRPLTSPIGGVACAAYDYVMSVTKYQRGEDTKAPVYWGYASERFSIDSRSRSYPIAGGIHYGWEPTVLDGDAARTRARAYVRSTGWETVEYGHLGTLDTILQRVGGSEIGVRKDFGQAYDTAPDVAILKLEERVLPIGATVSAFGTWSSALGAIVAPPSPLPASFVVVAEGGPAALDAAPGVPQSTTSYVVGAIVMLAIAAGLFWFATILIPTIRT